MADAIKIQQLTKFYGTSRGIENVDLTVPEGSFFGFIGPNGAGKSTTIRTLLGLIQATRGTATVLGYDVQKEKNQILEAVGYLPSETAFYTGMRVSEILQLSADLRKADCRENAQMLCHRLQLDTSRKIGELSFGNRKKVAIVCALQHDPKLLILDEPTSGLDPLMQKEFFSILRERNQEGTTVFLSSHVLSEIQQNCTHAAIIRQGSIIVSDRVEALAKTSAKRVCVHGAFDPAGLEGIRDMHSLDQTHSFLYSGDINRLLTVLSQGSISDLSISEPSLDEVFLHYYGEEAAK